MSCVNRIFELRIKADSDDFIPVFGTPEAAGADLKSSVDVILKPRVPELVDVGFSIEIPDGYYGTIVARSSMGKKGITIPNAPATIDSDYTGRIMVVLLNLTDNEYHISKGDKIAQWIMQKKLNYVWTKTETLKETLRGSAGFGSTGK